MILPKTLKFVISIALLLGTVLPILWILDISSRTRAAIAWTLIVTLAIELAAIVLQAARGTRSHFNTATPFDAAVWNTMMVAIVVALIALVVFAVLASIRTLDCDPLIATAIRIGAWLLLLTAISGFAMGGRGQHAVGGLDAAGAQLPVAGWSREHGDLRAPHFFAMHGIQVLPLAAWLLGGLSSERVRWAIFGIIAVVWVGLAIATLASAFAGRPLLR